MTYYINLFFLPVIPTNSSFYKYCPICNFRQNLTREEFYRQRDLAELNQEAVENDMAEEEYQRRRSKIRL